MVDKLYYPLTEVIIYYGICALISKIIIFSGKAIYQYKKVIEGIIVELKLISQKQKSL